MKLAEARVTIVGLGLIGGSMAAGLRGRCASLVGVDTDPDTLQLARDRAVVDRVETALEIGLGECDLTILAVPVRGILSILARIGHDLPTPKYILDVGSTKVEIVAAMRDLPARTDPLGGHPLCGKEISGLSAAEASLFRGKVFVLTPLDRTSQEMRQITDELVSALGARPLVMDAQDHDRLLAATSHLPYILATILVACADEVAASDPILWELVASGFRDSTRLAGSDIRMMMDILSTNRAEIESMIQKARSILGLLEAALQEGDFAALETQLIRARGQRLQLEPGVTSRVEGGA